MSHKEQAKQGLREKAEEISRTTAEKAPSTPDEMSAEEVRRLLHELRVHQIELEMQNVELRRAQVELDGERRRYFDLYDLAPVGYCTVSEEGLLLEANLAAINLLGLTRATLIGQRISRFILEEDQDSYYLIRKNLFASGQPQSCELRMVKKDGTVFSAHLAAVLAGDAGGAPVCRIVLSDISERKQNEAALRESEERHREYIMNTPYGVFATDERGRYLQVNPSACRITGYEERELLAMNMSDLLFEDSRPQGLLHFQKLVDEGKSQGEMPFRPKSGEKRWWSVTAVRLSGARFLGFCNDITDRKQAEEQRSHLQAHLQQAQKMEAIGTLAGGIAHDFNNILGAILGYAEMAREDSPAGSILRQDIDQVVKASHRAKELVKQILAFSHQTETVLIPIQPAIIVGEAAKMLRSSLPSSIDIRQNIDVNTGPILAHPIQIHQIVMNLGTNAFHAMEESGGTLSISLEKKTLTEKDIVGKPGVEPGDFVQLSIGDTGIGIAPELLGKIFDPYFTTKEIGKGTGMGLSIIHGIVKSYGGCVSVHSQFGEGTVFQVLLPVMAAETVVEVKPAEIVELGNERILFIDDEEILAEMGKSMLERLGYQVTVRSSSLEALTTFQDQPDMFDLVITDQTMPGMTGSDLARRILQIRPFMPIILCTGYSSLISEEKVRSLGIKGFAMKPLARKDIAAIIRKVLDKRVGGQGE